MAGKNNGDSSGVNRIQTSIHIDEDVKLEIEREAKQDGRSFSNFVEKLLREYLSRLNEEERE